MPTSAAERQRRYREKLKISNPEKFQEQKKKNCERTLRQYKTKTANYNEKQKEQLRKKWREDRKKGEEKVPSTSQMAMQNSQQNTKNIIDTQIMNNLQRRIEYKFKKENIKLRRKMSTMVNRFLNLQRKVQRQQNNIDSMKKMYEIIIMNLEENKTEDTNNTKDIENNLDNINITQPDDEVVPDLTNQLTPIKRVSAFIDKTIPNVKTPNKDIIKKKLIEHDLLKESFKCEYKNSTNAEKNILKKIVNSDVIKKYKQTTPIRASLGLKICSYKKRREYQKKRFQLQEQLASFYKRDDVSQTTAGKKEYRTQNKVKYQKRYLLDTLKNLHKKYITEVGEVSFSTFKKYRPFFVLPPNIKNSESCACIKHSNMQFMADKLKSFGLLQSNNLNDVVSDLVCDFKTKKCMYCVCADCSEREINSGDNDLETQVKWFKWSLKEYVYSKEDKVKKAKKMVKIINEGTLKELLETFNKEIKTFKRHVYNFYYQYNQYKLCVENLKEYEVIIHIDFSENYTCRYHQEVQAKHYVRDQITLHTGVLYLKDESPKSFCSISPDNRHNPESIWAHLDPVLKYIKTTYTNISIIHFFSDGPTTQYRQKKNFYLFSQKNYDYGFSHSTWSFFEAAHGKGAADGVGGAIKRTLDMKTAQGLDIPDAQAAYDALSSTDTTIKIFYIPAETIQSLDPLVVKNLTAIPGTMKIHQLISCGKYKLKYRDLSCFCENASGNCDCHFPVYYDFEESVSNNAQNLKRKQSIETAINLQKKKARRRESSSSSDSERHIEYAESDASDVLSDVSRNSDLDYFDENRHDIYLDENLGNFQKRIDPNKKINILSTVIIQKPLKNSNNDVETQVPSYVTKTKDEKTPTKHLDAHQQECNTTEILDFKKVTPLSQIRYSEENKAHLNLCLSKIFLEEGRKINPASNKENHAIPSTCKIDDSRTIKTDFKERQETMDIEVDASVIVRYYHRKQWKYYVGFVTQVLNKDDETFYKIRFLKTVKSPTLKIFMMKKSEIDIVPVNSIVKRVNLRSLGEAKEYFLKEEFDYVYFT